MNLFISMLPLVPKLQPTVLNIYAELNKAGYQHERIIINENKEQGLEIFKWVNIII